VGRGKSVPRFAARYLLNAGQVADRLALKIEKKSTPLQAGAAI
jgi:hypothetical protein